MNYGGEFLRSTVYVLSRVLSDSTTTTPFEAFFGKKPDVGNLKVIRCRGYVHVPDCLRQELDAKAVAFWLVGFGEETKAGSSGALELENTFSAEMLFFDEKVLITDSTEQYQQTDGQLLHPLILTTKILDQEGDSELTKI